MRYELIYINGFMYAVKHGLPLHLRPIKVEGGAWVYSDKIVATNDPSLNLPLLPAVEEDSWELMRASALVLKNYDLKDEFNVAAAGGFCSGYEEGYKAASSKQFTEEDMRKAIQLSKTYKQPSISGNFSSTGLYGEDEIIQSLKPKPVAVELEMIKQFDHDKKGKITTIDESEAYHGAAFIWIPTVDENNFVKIKQFYYE